MFLQLRNQFNHNILFLKYLNEFRPLIEPLISTHLQIPASLMLIVLLENGALRNTTLKCAGLVQPVVMMLTANVDANWNVLVT